MPERQAIVQPDPVFRRRALFGLLSGAVLGAAALVALERYSDRLLATADVESLLLGFHWAVLGVTASLLGLAAWLFWLAKRIFRTGQFPLPGQKVIKPTPLRTGDAARRLAWFALFAGLFITVAALAMAVMFWQLLQSLASSL